MSSSGYTALVRSALADYPQLDPQAVFAVSGQEGLSGGIGDNGHAFGPFQLNNAGGVITGMFAGRTPEQINQWAWSPEGIDFALRHVNAVAGGLRGPAAVNAIVNRFERPADPAGEASRALAAYGPLGNTNVGSPGPGAAARLTGAPGDTPANPVLDLANQLLGHAAAAAPASNPLHALADQLLSA